MAKDSKVGMIIFLGLLIWGISKMPQIAKAEEPEMPPIPIPEPSPPVIDETPPEPIYLAEWSQETGDYF